MIKLQKLIKSSLSHYFALEDIVGKMLLLSLSQFFIYIRNFCYCIIKWSCTLPLVRGGYNTNRKIAQKLWLISSSNVSSRLVLRCQRAVTAKVSMTIRKFRIQNSSAGHWIFLILLDGSQKYRYSEQDQGTQESSRWGKYYRWWSGSCEGHQSEQRGGCTVVSMVSYEPRLYGSSTKDFPWLSPQEL